MLQVRSVTKSEQVPFLLTRAMPDVSFDRQDSVGGDLRIHCIVWRVSFRRCSHPLAKTMRLILLASQPKLAISSTRAYLEWSSAAVWVTGPACQRKNSPRPSGPSSRP